MNFLFSHLIMFYLLKKYYLKSYKIRINFLILHLMNLDDDNAIISTLRIDVNPSKYVFF